MSVLHQTMCIFKTGLSSSYDGWAKYNEKVPDVSEPNQNVETTCNSKLKFTWLKDLFTKKLQKNQSKMNDYKCINYMYLANTTILNIPIFSRRYYLWLSDYRFLLRLVNNFTIDTDEYYQMCYNVNDAKTFKNLLYCIYFYGCSQIIIYVYCRLARLTGAFEIILI